MSVLAEARMRDKNAAAVRVRGLRRAFGGNAVLDGLDLDIAPGEFVALLGRSGSGKTTLLRTLAGLDPVAEGTVVAPGAHAVVFQEPRLMPWKTVWQNVALGIRSPDAHARALAALDEVGLGHRVQAWPATLSGGEAQRAALARALVREPQLLLLDEPFAAVDALTRIRMHRLVADLWLAHKPSVLLVTHDVDEALLLADRALVLGNGRIETEIVLDAAHPRDRAMAGFSALRGELLAALGVDSRWHDDAAPNASDKFREAAMTATGGRDMTDVPQARIVRLEFGANDRDHRQDCSHAPEMA